MSFILEIKQKKVNEEIYKVFIKNRICTPKCILYKTNFKIKINYKVNYKVNYIKEALRDEKNSGDRTD